VAAVQYTFTHKQYTEYRDGNIYNNKKLGTYIAIKNLKLILEVRAVPRLCVLYPGICLTTEKKDGKTSVSVAARTSPENTVKHKNNEQYNTQKKNSNTEQYNVTEQYRTLNTPQTEQSISGK
jgi:hypothetical protein